LPDEPAAGSLDFYAPARAWAVRHVERAPWAGVAARASLLLVSPPQAPWADPEAIGGALPAAWLIVDRADVRGLPPAQREPLAIHGVLIEDVPGGALTVFVAEAVELLFEGVTRRAIEVRWTLSHSEPLHDPLHRLDSWGRALSALPRDGEERVLRPLFLQAVEALDALATGGLPAAGEAAAAVSRLVCVLDSGLHPPVEWLALETRGTALGTRLASWLDDLARAAGGDTDAFRRAISARDGVRRTLAEPTKERIGAADWLTGPRAYALRPPR
jgi:hypothetical protein